MAPGRSQKLTAKLKRPEIHRHRRRTMERMILDRNLCVCGPEPKTRADTSLKALKRLSLGAKRRLRGQLPDERAKHCPFRSTRSELSQRKTGDVAKEVKTNSNISTTARIAHMHKNPICNTTLCDDGSSIPCRGRFDDGSDETLF